MDNKYVDDLIWQVESFLQSKENMICQRILCENSNYTVLQAKLRGGKIKQFSRNRFHAVFHLEENGVFHPGHPHNMLDELSFRTGI